MTEESIRFEIKKLKVWYENKVAVSSNIKDKDYYQAKIEVLDEILSKI